MVSLGLVIISSEDVEVKRITSGIMTKAWCFSWNWCLIILGMATISVKLALTTYIMYISIDIYVYVLKITVRIWHFWCLRERATSFHLCHTEAETHGSHLQPRLADLGLHSFVFCQDLGLVFPTLPSPASLARHSNLVPCWGTAVVRRWLDFMFHCNLLGCGEFFLRGL